MTSNLPAKISSSQALQNAAIDPKARTLPAILAPDASLPATSYDPFEEWKKREQLQGQATRLNKATIIEALKSAGVTCVCVEFDGSGDSGAIENVTCQGASETIPEVLIEEWRVVGGTLIGAPNVKLADAVENLAYDLLEQKHPGWEIDAGAFGDITIDVAKDAVTHTHNDRFEDYETSTYNY